MCISQRLVGDARQVPRRVCGAPGTGRLVHISELHEKRVRLVEGLLRPANGPRAVPGSRDSQAHPQSVGTDPPDSTVVLPTKQCHIAVLGYDNGKRLPGLPRTEQRRRTMSHSRDFLEQKGPRLPLLRLFGWICLLRY